MPERETPLPFEEEIKTMSLEELRTTVDKLHGSYQGAATHFGIPTEDFPDINPGVPLWKDEKIVDGEKKRYQAAKAELTRRETQERSGTNED